MTTAENMIEICLASYHSTDIWFVLIPTFGDKRFGDERRLGDELHFL